MKTLMTTISALALSVTLGHAQTVNDAWQDSAQTVPVVKPGAPSGVNAPDPLSALKPGPLTVPMRDFKTCTGGGQCAFVDQIGTGNDADIEHGDAPGGTIADIVQVGNFNDASIEQRDGAGSHYGVVTQNGDGNAAAIRQHSDIVTGATYADIEQGGDDTLANGSQGGFAGAANNNTASIDQGVTEGGASVLSYGNKARIGQGTRGLPGTSDFNIASIVQRGDEMLSRIEQDGNENEAEIRQAGVGFSANSSDPEENEALIDQVGNLNTAYAYQEGESQDSLIVQSGDNNMASTEQFGVEEGTGNTAWLVQVGNDNMSTMLQDGDGNMASNLQAGNDNDSSILQDGDDNEARADQFGNSNVSHIEQFGNAHIASVVQNGGDLADVQQSGMGNVAAVTQN